MALKSVSMKAQTRSLQTIKTANADERTIEVSWGKGVRGLRYGQFGEGGYGEYYEELSMDPAHVRMGRLQAGASVLDSHRSYGGLSATLGIVQDAKLVNGEGLATIKLSSRAEVKGINDDILEGMIRNLSVGYNIYKMVQVGIENDIPVLRAVDWEPYEISYVNVGFDDSAKSRSVDETFHKCEISTEEKEPVMTKSADENKAEREERDAAHTRALEDHGKKAAKDAVEAERKRSSEIRSLAEKHQMLPAFADKLINDETSIEKARELILDEISTRGAIHINTISAGSQDEKTTMQRAITETIQLRYAPQFNKPSELTARYRSATILDMCKDMIRSQGMRPELYTKSEIAERALHTSSDFPLLLGNSLKKILSDNYNAQPADFNFLTQPQGMSDYKQLGHYGLSSGPSLLEVKEHGEYKRGSVSEAAEFMQLKKYGRIIGITREAIINDDLSAFARIPRLWASAAANLQADLIVSQFVGNPVMADGVTLFHASHGNLAGTASALSITSLAEAVAALESQKAPSVAGEQVNFLRLRARYLIVPPGLKVLAQQLTTSIDPVTFATVNPFSYLEVKSDPSLTGTAWYVAADAATVDTIALMYLEGEQGPQLSERQGFDVDGVEYKVRLDTGAKILDYRWIFKNAGV